MASYDMQIKGGTIVDGTRVPRYRGDVWIKDGRIAQLGGRAPGSAEEVVDIFGARVAPEGIQVRHPAFDVTPARLITAIITERGVLRPPYEEAIRALYNDCSPRSGSAAASF